MFISGINGNENYGYLVERAKYHPRAVIIEFHELGAKDFNAIMDNLGVIRTAV
jgi:hypothetical protein